MTLRVVLEYDDVTNSWVAYCLELPGANSHCAMQKEKYLKISRKPQNCFLSYRFIKFCYI